jgi:hypothetical protein
MSLKGSHRFIAWCLLLAATMQALLPLAYAARGTRGTQMQVLCTAHGPMWVVVDDAGSTGTATKVVQGAACPACAGAGATALAPPIPGPGAAPTCAAHGLSHESPLLEVTPGVSRPWRLHLASRAPPLS